jgi:biopolymer transport protein ExbD
MSMQVPETEDTVLNMTPMIDIVFQLVTFFLLTLHFATPEDRIEGQLPKDRGPFDLPAVVDELEGVKVKLFRKNKENPDEAYTKVRVGNDWEIALPKGRRAPDMPREEAEALQREIDARFDQIAAKLREEWRRFDNRPDVHAEIAAPPPDGPAVPHGEVVRLLDVFMEIGMKEVGFQGAVAPLPGPEGGTMYD